MSKEQYDKEKAIYEELLRYPEIRRNHLLDVADLVEKRFREVSEIPTFEEMCEIVKIFQLLEEFKKSYQKAKSMTY